MSDTPRTDAAWETLPSVYEFIKEMKRMERELNAANERIKRLEEAGDALLELCEAEQHQLHLADQIDNRCENWRKAKQSNP